MTGLSLKSFHSKLDYWTIGLPKHLIHTYISSSLFWIQDLHSNVLHSIIAVGKFEEGECTSANEQIVLQKFFYWSICIAEQRDAISICGLGLKLDIAKVKFHWGLQLYLYICFLLSFILIWKKHCYTNLKNWWSRSIPCFPHVSEYLLPQYYHNPMWESQYILSLISM